jgi:hypothetical protein
MTRRMTFPSRIEGLLITTEAETICLETCGSSDPCKVFCMDDCPLARAEIARWRTRSAKCDRLTATRCPNGLNARDALNIAASLW